MKKIKVAIAGATGFVGLELLKILTKHPNVDILYLYSQSKLKKSINLYSKNFKFKKKTTQCFNNEKSRAQKYRCYIYSATTWRGSSDF